MLNFDSFTIEWRITSKCNNKCFHCYASDNVPSVSKEEIDKIIEKISKVNCRAVCITGGEPLIESNVYYIIKSLYDHGISIYLSTNGTNYLENINKIEPYISRLSLPLDGYDSVSNTINGRRDDSFKTVKEILDYYKNNLPKFEIKIGTVLTKYNMEYDHFEKMYDFLIKYPINKWRIYELVPEQSGLNLYSSNGYEKSDFLEFKTNALKNLINRSEKQASFIHFSSRDERNGAYCMIKANGEVFVPIDDGKKVEECLMGNVVNDSLEQIIKEWKEKRIELEKGI